jgi:hypothetical protein
MSNGKEKERTTSNQRIAFDDDNGKASTTAMTAPQESEHWQFLVHEESDKWIYTLDELKDRFRSDLRASSSSSSNSDDTASEIKASSNGGETMALWSCLAGYCEALATHKDAGRRYQIFPIPIDALHRLVTTEFWSRVLVPAEATVEAAAASKTSCDAKAYQAKHRARVKAVANAVWNTAVNSQKRDEEHANSLYVCLRGNIDRKSIDCLGSSVTTLAGVKLLQSRDEEESFQTAVTSMLTLSEGKLSGKIRCERILGNRRREYDTTYSITLRQTQAHFLPPFTHQLFPLHRSRVRKTYHSCSGQHPQHWNPRGNLRGGHPRINQAAKGKARL